MTPNQRILNAVLGCVAIGLVACGDDSDGGSNQNTTAEYPAQECAATKQEAAGDYCRRSLDAWASWETT